MTAPIPRVLVVDDRREMRQRLSRELEHDGLSVRAASSLREALELARASSPDAVLASGRLAVDGGESVLAEFRAHFPGVRLVALTARDDASAAARALELGAFQSVPEGVEQLVLANVLRRASEASWLSERLQRLQARASDARATVPWVAVSDAACEALRRVRSAVADGARGLLIVGERGVGKARLAAAFHAERLAWDEPFFAVNCAALAPDELELELFGCEAAGPAPSHSPRRGLFELAGSGTVLLNEFAAAPDAVQAQLLRLLDTGGARRRGGVVELPIAARLVCTSQRGLEREVAARGVRADLLERLRATCIELPPLRERAEDIEPLAEHVLARVSAELDRPVRAMAPQACAALRAYDWPGNARELEAVLTRAVLLARGTQLELGDLPTDLVARSLHGASSQPADSAAFDLPTAGLDLEQLELHLLKQALERSRGNRTRAARLLGLNRDRIRYRIQKFGLEPTPLGGSGGHGARA